MSKTPKIRKHAAPGRRRVENPKNDFIAVRCTAQERAAITELATKSGLAVGAYLRATALGHPGPRAVRRPPIERKELARLLGHLGKVGSNINQLAYAFNSTRRIPGLAELPWKGTAALTRRAKQLGGGRWFAKKHVAFSFDVRFYAINPGPPNGRFVGSPRTTLLVIGGGVSVKP